MESIACVVGKKRETSLSSSTSSSLKQFEFRFQQIFFIIARNGSILVGSSFKFVGHNSPIYDEYQTESAKVSTLL